MDIRFFNSVEGGAFWKSLLDELRQRGCRVSHPFALSEAQYRAPVGRLGRITRLFRMYPGYLFRVLVARDTPDVCVATTNPFCLPAVVAFRRGGRAVFLMYDLFPDALILAGMIRPRGLAARALGRITRYGLTHSAATVFLGKRLQDHAESIYGPVRHAVVIAVGADGKPFRDSPPVESPEPDAVRFVYVGNMGRAHDARTITSYLRRPANPSARWLFAASGGEYRSLKGDLGGSPSAANCVFQGPLDDDDWVRMMIDAQVALVTMKPGWETVVMPSKAYSSLVAGQAILAICPPESDLADLVRKHDCGWVVSPGDVDGLARTVDRIVSDRAMLFKKRSNAFEAGHRFYDAAVVAGEWERVLMPLRGGGGKRVAGGG